MSQFKKQKTSPILNPLIASSSSSSQSSSPPASYDVFLSFRGEDTRKTFVDHFYSALVQRLIHTYKDDETLPRGVSIGPSLLNAIKQSHIAVIIFSKNYADSSWCLDELEFIMKCKEETGLIVMPVFYDVDPSDVRKQKGDFGEGFAKQHANNITKIELWRKTLVDASNLSGWETKNVANGHESKVIKEIVDTIFNRLFPSISYIDDDLVGMTTRLQEIKAQLKLESDDVHMLGIWGVGGGGKTTLATSVYIKISHQFEGTCIVENIREESSKNSYKKLQEDILSSILNKHVEVRNLIDGKNKIQTMLCHRKVLILLDDVDKLDQLQALAGSHKWFGGGSRIIITTRDENLLRAHKVNVVYPVRLLSDDEALLLFKVHAYNDNNPVKGYEKLSSRVVSYASGLPLALRVIGSFLYNKDENEWMSALDRLKDIPEMEIMEKLKISYDGLKTVEKDLFLDIACFFRKWSTFLFSTEDVMEIFEACGYHPCIGIKTLREKALITINRDGRFDMHDLVQEMALFIVRGEDPQPEKHSRVWKHEDVINMCSSGSIMAKNVKIEAIHCVINRYHDHDSSSSRLCMIVSKMKQLRWLKVNLCDKKFDEGPTFLSNKLKYFCWKNYPASPFPDNFKPVNLVVLKLNVSLQKQLWTSDQRLPHLKVLELKEMKNLISTPHFGGLPRLQKFVLKNCWELEKIDLSLGYHITLEYIKVSHCHRVRKFPTIVNMEKLKTLRIKSCDAITEFPKIQANMESLVDLYLNEIGIEVLPSSIGERCTNLTSLTVASCYDLESIQLISLDGLRKLKLVDLDFIDGEIPSDIGALSSLEELDLSCIEFTRIDFSLSQLTHLKLLNLWRCESLIELPKLPSSLAILRADRCESLTTVGDCYKDCKSLCEVSFMEGGIVTDGDRLLEYMLQGNAIEDQSMLLQLKGVEIPKGFIPPLLVGETFTLQLPNNWRDDFCGFLFCVVFNLDFLFLDIFFNIDLREAMLTIIDDMDSGQNDTEHTCTSEEGMDSRQNDVVWEEGSEDKMTWVGYIPFGSLRHTCWWDHLTYNPQLSFFIHSDHYRFCRGFGVRLVSRNSRDGRLRETFPSSDQLSHYKPDFKIKRDSADNLRISLGMASV